VDALQNTRYVTGTHAYHGKLGKLSVADKLIGSITDRVFAEKPTTVGGIRRTGGSCLDIYRVGGNLCFIDGTATKCTDFVYGKFL